MRTRSHFIENEVIALDEQLDGENSAIVASLHKMFTGIDNAAAELVFRRLLSAGSFIQCPGRHYAQVEDSAFVDVAAYREMDGVFSVSYQNHAAFVVELDERFEDARDTEHVSSCRNIIF